MKIWQLRVEVDKYDNLIPVIPFSVEEIKSFDGRKHMENWKPIKVKRMEPEKHLELSDSPGFVITVFSKFALECLLPLIKDYVEVLKPDFEEGEYFAINVIKVIDAIDYEKSKYTKFRDGKRILAFDKYVFIPEKVSEIPIFKISDEKHRWPFVSDELKRIIEANNLTGFNFKLVWDSEEK